MDWTNEFDKAIDELSRNPLAPRNAVSAAVHVHETLQLAKKSAGATFDADVTADHAIRLCELMVTMHRHLDWLALKTTEAERDADA